MSDKNTPIAFAIVIVTISLIALILNGCEIDGGDTEKDSHQISRDDDCKRTVQLPGDMVWCGGVKGFANPGDGGTND